MKDIIDGFLEHAISYDEMCYRLLLKKKEYLTLGLVIGIIVGLIVSATL